MIVYQTAKLNLNQHTGHRKAENKTFMTKGVQLHLISFSAHS